MAETITASITAVTKARDGLQLAGYQNWFNLGKFYEGVPIPAVGTEVEIKYEPWTSDKGNTSYYIKELVPVTQVAAPPLQAEPPRTAAPMSYDGLQQAAAERVAPSPTPVAEPPRTGPESPQPDPGSFPYRDLVGIPMSNALNNAVALLVGTYGAGAAERLTGEQIVKLATNAHALASVWYKGYYKEQWNLDAAPTMPADIAEPATDGDPRPEEPRG